MSKLPPLGLSLPQDGRPNPEGPTSGPPNGNPNGLKLASMLTNLKVQARPNLSGPSIGNFGGGLLILSSSDDDYGDEDYTSDYEDSDNSESDSEDDAPPLQLSLPFRPQQKVQAVAPPPQFGNAKVPPSISLPTSNDPAPTTNKPLITPRTSTTKNPVPSLLSPRNQTTDYVSSRLTINKGHVTAQTHYNHVHVSHPSRDSPQSQNAPTPRNGGPQAGIKINITTPRNAQSPHEGPKRVRFSAHSPGTNVPPSTSSSTVSSFTFGGLKGGSGVENQPQNAPNGQNANNTQKSKGLLGLMGLDISNPKSFDTMYARAQTKGGTMNNKQFRQQQMQTMHYLERLHNQDIIQSDDEPEPMMRDTITLARGSLTGARRESIKEEYDPFSHLIPEIEEDVHPLGHDDLFEHHLLVSKQRQIKKKEEVQKQTYRNQVGSQIKAISTTVLKKTPHSSSPASSNPAPPSQVPQPTRLLQPSSQQTQTQNQKSNVPVVPLSTSLQLPPSVPGPGLGSSKGPQLAIQIQNDPTNNHDENSTPITTTESSDPWSSSRGRHRARSVMLPGELDETPSPLPGSLPDVSEVSPLSPLTPQQASAGQDDVLKEIRAMQRQFAPDQSKARSKSRAVRRRKDGDDEFGALGGGGSNKDGLDISKNGTLILRDLRINGINEAGGQEKGSNMRVGRSNYLEASQIQQLKRDDLQELSVLGSGASGRVVKCLHIPTGLVVALKSIDITERAKRSQFIKEIEQLLTEDRGDHLVSCYNMFYDDGTINIALEYMDRGSLETIIEKGGPVSEEVIATIVRQSLYGLQHLHSQRKVHRDIKPGNILVDHNGVVKLSDFGIMATLKDEATDCNTFVGTTVYMSPERLDGKPYSYAGDIWSLGLTILYLAIGKHPIEADRNGFFGILSRVLKDPAPKLDPELFSPFLCDLVACCLIKDPTLRYSTQQLLDHPFLAPENSLTVNETIPFWAEPLRMCAKGEEWRIDPSIPGPAVDQLDASSNPSETPTVLARPEDQRGPKVLAPTSGFEQQFKLHNNNNNTANNSSPDVNQDEFLKTQVMTPEQLIFIQQLQQQSRGSISSRVPAAASAAAQTGSSPVPAQLPSSSSFGPQPNGNNVMNINNNNPAGEKSVPFQFPVKKQSSFLMDFVQKPQNTPSGQSIPNNASNTSNTPNPNSKVGNINPNSNPNSNNNIANNTNNNNISNNTHSQFQNGPGNSSMGHFNHQNMTPQSGPIRPMVHQGHDGPSSLGQNSGVMGPMGYNSGMMSPMGSSPNDMMQHQQQQQQRPNSAFSQPNSFMANNNNNNNLNQNNNMSSNQSSPFNPNYNQPYQANNFPQNNNGPSRFNQGMNLGNVNMNNMPANNNNNMNQFQQGPNAPSMGPNNNLVFNTPSSYSHSGPPPSIQLVPGGAINSAYANSTGAFHQNSTSQSQSPGISITHTPPMLHLDYSQHNMQQQQQHQQMPMPMQQQQQHQQMQMQQHQQQPMQQMQPMQQFPPQNPNQGFNGPQMGPNMGLNNGPNPLPPGPRPNPNLHIEVNLAEYGLAPKPKQDDSLLLSLISSTKDAHNQAQISLYHEKLASAKTLSTQNSQISLSSSTSQDRPTSSQHSQAPRTPRNFSPHIQNSLPTPRSGLSQKSHPVDFVEDEFDRLQGRDEQNHNLADFIDAPDNGGDFVQSEFDRLERLKDQQQGSLEETQQFKSWIAETPRPSSPSVSSATRRGAGATVQRPVQASALLVPKNPPNPPKVDSSASSTPSIHPLTSPVNQNSIASGQRRPRHSISPQSEAYLPNFASAPGANPITATSVSATSFSTSPPHPQNTSSALVRPNSTATSNMGTTVVHNHKGPFYPAAKNISSAATTPATNANASQGARRLSQSSPHPQEAVRAVYQQSQSQSSLRKEHGLGLTIRPQSGHDVDFFVSDVLGSLIPTTTSNTTGGQGQSVEVDLISGNFNPTSPNYNNPGGTTTTLIFNQQTQSQSDLGDFDPFDQPLSSPQPHSHHSPTQNHVHLPNNSRYGQQPLQQSSRGPQPQGGGLKAPTAPTKILSPTTPRRGGQVQPIPAYTGPQMGLGTKHNPSTTQPSSPASPVPLNNFLGDTPLTGPGRLSTSQAPQPNTFNPLFSSPLHSQPTSTSGGHAPYGQEDDTSHRISGSDMWKIDAPSIRSPSFSGTNNPPHSYSHQNGLVSRSTSFSSQNILSTHNPNHGGITTGSYNNHNNVMRSPSFSSQYNHNGPQQNNNNMWPK